MRGMAVVTDVNDVTHGINYTYRYHDNAIVDNFFAHIIELLIAKVLHFSFEFKYTHLLLLGIFERS